MPAGWKRARGTTGRDKEAVMVTKRQDIGAHVKRVILYLRYLGHEEDCNWLLMRACEEQTAPLRAISFRSMRRVTLSAINGCRVA